MTDKIKGLFDTWAGTERGERMATGHDLLVEHIYDMWDMAEVKHLLDIGCGNGRALVLAKERGVNAFAGIDLSDKMIATAKQNLPEADLHNGSMSDLSVWGDNSFSHIISIEALYYSDAPLEVIQEMKRVLQSDGKVAIAIEFYKENKGSLHWQDAMPFTMNLLSEQEWVTLFHEAGLTDVKASRIKRGAVKPESEFTASSFFPTYEAYRQYTDAGALLLTN